MKQIKITDVTNSKSFTFYNNSNDTILRQFEGWEYPTTNVSVEDVAGAQSSVFVASKFGRRRLSFIGDLVAADVFSQRRTMLAAMRQTSELKLIECTTYDDLLIRFEAEIVKLVNPYTHQIHTYMVELVAPDWRFYSQTLKSNSIAANATDDFENEGNEETSPIFTITAPGDDISVTNLTTGETFNIGNLTGTQEVIVDVGARTVTLDGSAAMNIFTGEFFSLVPGVNEIEFDVPTSSTGATQLQVQWRDAYNGV
jgi:hypothetical protein